MLILNSKQASLGLFDLIWNYTELQYLAQVKCKYVKPDIQ